MAADPQSFHLQFWLTLAFVSLRFSINPAVAGISNFLTDRENIDIDAARPERIQIRVCTDHYKNSTYPPGPNRIQVVRLIMDFWRPLADVESEIDVFGAIPQGIMHDDFAFFGGVDYWRDTFQSDGPGGILGIDTEGGAPEFTWERIGLMAHYRISVGLMLAP